MATAMHRLQISLPEWQTQFLAERARRDGVSVAEVVRRLVQREAKVVRGARSVDSIWEIAGIGEDREPRIDGIPVSEQPDLHVAEAARPCAPARAGLSGSRARPGRRTRIAR